MKNKINYKVLFINLLIPLTVGGLSALITRSSMKIYEVLEKPRLAPPGIVFPIVWVILFVLMGISSYIIFTSSQETAESCANRKTALRIYALQLFFNFLWPVAFFFFGFFLFAFIWLLVLIVLIFSMICYFMPINETAARLQFPYLLWSIFAAYLNWGIYWLNR